MVERALVGMQNPMWNGSKFTISAVYHIPNWSKRLDSKWGPVFCARCPVNRKCYYFLLRSTFNIYDLKQHVSDTKYGNGAAAKSQTTCECSHLESMLKFLFFFIQYFLYPFNKPSLLWANFKMWIHFVSFLIYVWLYVSSAVHYVICRIRKIFMWRD